MQKCTAISARERSVPSSRCLEERALMSHVGPRAAGPAYAALVRHLPPAIATDPAGVAAIMSALNGGMGSEWVKLIRSKVQEPERRSSADS